MENELIWRNVPDVSVLASMQERALGPGVASPLHYHDEIEFIVVYEGIISCTAYGREYEAGPGEVIFINSRVPHSTYRKTEHRIGLIQFREGDFSQNGTEGILTYRPILKASQNMPVKIYNTGELFSVADELLRESAERDTGYGVFVRSCIFRLLGILYRDGVLTDSERLYTTREREKIMPILSYLNENYAKQITLDRASAMLGFDTSYFCRIFKAATGATFTEYLNFVRISKSESRLSEGKESILEISEAVGFSSVSYFNRIFKRYKGCAPSVYRTARYSVE